MLKSLFNFLKNELVIALFSIVITTAIIVRWEAFNWKSTYQPLVWLVGEQSWVRIFADSVIFTDILFYLRTVLTLFLDERKGGIFKKIRSDELTRVILAGYVVVTLADTAFTYFFIDGSIKLQGANLLIPDILQNRLWTFPLAIACITWFAQAVLLYSASMSLTTAVRLIVASTDKKVVSRPETSKKPVSDHHEQIRKMSEHVKTHTVLAEQYLNIMNRTFGTYTREQNVPSARSIVQNVQRITGVAMSPSSAQSGRNKWIEKHINGSDES